MLPMKLSKRGSNAMTLKAEADAGTYDSIGLLRRLWHRNVPEEDRAQVVETYQTTLDNTQDARRCKQRTGIQ